MKKLFPLEKALKMYADRKIWDFKEIVVFMDQDKFHKEDSNNFDKPGAKVSKFST